MSRVFLVLHATFDSILALSDDEPISEFSRCHVLAHHKSSQP